MNMANPTMRTACTRPGAWVPWLMSLAALAVVLGHVALAGTARTTDEGAAAHIFQLLIAGQLPVVAWHAIRWLRRAPRQAMAVLAMQAFAILVAIGPVWYFDL